MLLQDLKVGDQVTLEVVWGELEYQIPTKVAYVEEKDILIGAFSYGGHTLDFGRADFKHLIINLYAIDPAVDKRYCWKNIAIRIRNCFGKDFYEIKINEFKKYGAESERRQNRRIDLNLNAQIKIGTEQNSHFVILQDVSNTGISFTSNEDMDLSGQKICIFFDDSVREYEFHLEIDCISVRKIVKENQFLYGCKIVEASKEAFTYLYMKTIERNAANKK